MIPPLHFQWDGDALVPLHPKLADKHLVIGERYCMVEHQERSQASHNHEFAWLTEAWRNLPERYAEQFPSVEHLRKRALIDAGYYHETVIDAGTNAAALRVAAYVRGKDEFALVIVKGPLVFERTAKSQSRRAMNKRDFEESKAAIMDLIAGMVGVTSGELQQNVGRAA